MTYFDIGQQALPGNIWDMSQSDILAVGAFAGHSVIEETMKKYRAQWEQWSRFISRMGMPDPYLRGATPDQKLKLYMNYVRLKYLAGDRDRKATDSSGIKKFLTMDFQNTDWLDSTAASAVRRACKRTPEENRERVRNKGDHDKKPIWWELLQSVRDDLWSPGDWSHEHIDNKMVSINIWFSYDLGTRGGETSQATKDPKHTILNEDVVFWLYNPVYIEGKETKALRAGSDLMRSLVTPSNVEHIEVKAVTHKTGLIRAQKIVGRRSPEEITLLEDLVSWCINSGAGPQEPVFSRVTWFPRKREPTFKLCKPSMIARVIKGYAELAGLDPDEFGTHSLRHGMVTQMHAFGMTIQETNARGNYARESTLTQTTYNGDDTGRGPLAASTSGTGRRVGVKDIERQMSVPYQS